MSDKSDASTKSDAFDRRVARSAGERAFSTAAWMRMLRGMRADDEGRLTSRLRRAALALEKRAAAGLASGAVQGAADELEALSDDELHALLSASVRALGRFASDAAEGPGALAEELGRKAAQGAVAGGVSELKRSLPRVEALIEDLIRLIHSGVRQREEEAQSLRDRRQGRMQAGERAATAMVTGVVRGLQLHAPELQTLSRSAVHSVVTELGDELKPTAARLQRGLAWVAGAVVVGAAIVAVSRRR
ncbi:MAG: hypothetical protein JST54_30430 [Deltaproteobacteria bacterium]|nr:hypothetical protein [Deltaproteobacteria bacterium]